MKRELKFRAWDPITKTLFGLSSIDFSKKCDRPIMQFTGLKDKNGKEIYEGDIVKGIGVTSYGKPIIRKVSFHGPSARFGLADLHQNITFEPLQWISFPLEIIGNIHENPQLWTP